MERPEKRELHRVAGKRVRDRGGSKESEGQRRWSGDRARTLQSRCQGTAAQEAESEGPSALGDRGWVRGCCRAWGRGGGELGGADPKGMVSARGAGVLKGQQEKGPRVRAGAGRGGQGSGSQGPLCPHWVRGAKPQRPASRRDGRSHAQSPRETMPAAPRVRGPNPNPPRSRRSVRDSAASVSRGGAGAGTQRGPTLPFQNWLRRIAFLFHWLYLLPSRKKPERDRQSAVRSVVDCGNCSPEEDLNLFYFIF